MVGFRRIILSLSPSLAPGQSLKPEGINDHDIREWFCDCEVGACQFWWLLCLAKCWMNSDDVWLELTWGRNYGVPRILNYVRRRNWHFIKSKNIYLLEKNGCDKTPIWHTKIKWTQINQSIDWEMWITQMCVSVCACLCVVILRCVHHNIDFPVEQHNKDESIEFLHVFWKEIYHGKNHHLLTAWWANAQFVYHLWNEWVKYSMPSLR